MLNFLVFFVADVVKLLRGLLDHYFKILNNVIVFGLRLRLTACLTLQSSSNIRMPIQVQIRCAPLDVPPELLQYHVPDTHKLIVPDATHLLRIGLERLLMLQ